MTPPRAILLTRTTAENRRIAPLFAEKGIAVLSVPMIALREIPFDHALLPTSTGSLLVLLTSREATTRWLALRRDDARCRALDVRGYLVVGEGSQGLIGRAAGEARVVLVADSIDALCTIVRRRKRTILPAGEEHRILYPCSAARRDDGIERLAALGAEVIELPLYTPVIPSESASDFPHALARLVPGDAILFFSPSAVENFFALLRTMESDEPQSKPTLDDLRIIAIGETTAAAVRSHDVEDVETPERPDVQAIVAMLVT